MLNWQDSLPYSLYSQLCTYLALLLKAILSPLGVRIYCMQSHQKGYKTRYSYDRIETRLSISKKNAYTFIVCMGKSTSYIASTYCDKVIGVSAYISILYNYVSVCMESVSDICVYRNDECVEGGESIIVDALAVVEKFRVTHPHHFSTLVRVPATFHRIHYDRYIHS